MRHNLPKHVRKKVAKGKAYYYFDTGRANEAGRPLMVRLPDVRSPEFGAKLAALQGARTKRKGKEGALTLAFLADLFERSVEFRRLAPATQNSYRLYLKTARDRLGIAPADQLTPEDVMIVRDEMAETPGAANQLIRVLGALYKWGRKRQRLTAKPTHEVDYLDGGEHEPWPAWLLEEALKDDEVRLPVAMLYYTAQRIGDVCRMGWSDVRGGAVAVRQQKTGKDLLVPFHRNLAAMLAGEPRRGLTILSREDGSAWKPAHLRGKLQRWAEGKGAKVVPHGLRKNAVNALLEAGCSVAETAAISGQTLQVVEHYAKQRNQSHLASAAILRWDKA